jgi:hypothetical protein
MSRGIVFGSVFMIAVLIAVVWGARGQSQEVSSQTRWEYKIVSYEWLSGIYAPEDARKKGRTLQELEVLNDNVAQRMTEFGRQGWELVCFHEKRGFVFKREAR